jgi:hypothetical protein
MPWVSMELDDEDKMDVAMPMPMATPDYPPGLRFCLTHKELSKVDLDSDCKVGDMIDMRIMAEVTHKSEDSDSCRIELQIMLIKRFEDEDTED